MNENNQWRKIIPILKHTVQLNALELNLHLTTDQQPLCVYLWRALLPRTYLEHCVLGEEQFPGRSRLRYQVRNNKWKLWEPHQQQEQDDGKVYRISSHILLVSVPVTTARQLLIGLTDLVEEKFCLLTLVRLFWGFRPPSLLSPILIGNVITERSRWLNWIIARIGILESLTRVTENTKSNSLLRQINKLPLVTHEVNPSWLFSVNRVWD